MISCILFAVLFFNLFPYGYAAEISDEIVIQEQSYHDELKNEFDDEQDVSAVVPLPEDFDDPDAGGFTATLYTSYGSSTFTSSVSYALEYNYFFGDSTLYRPSLAKASLVLSAIAYDNHYLVTKAASQTISTVAQWFHYHGFSDWESYDLNDYYDDQHVSQMFVGHKSYTYNGEEKHIVCVVIRGTNGTLKEWQSNFDIGTTADFAAYSEWKNSSNHMGFDITANRLNIYLARYLSTHDLAYENYALWITGHSRGGALANIMAATRVDSGAEVFAYTFASPNTTQKENADTAAEYKCIHNIVNSDDLITEIPLTEWGFCRYGNSAPRSVNSFYYSQWEDMLNISYKCNNAQKTNVLAAFIQVSGNRNDCYTVRSTGYITPIGLYFSEDAAELAAIGWIESYPDNTAGTCDWLVTGGAEYYSFVIYQTPAFLFQVLAAAVSREISEIEYGSIDMAWYLKESKWDIAWFYLGDGFNHPHYLESYYLLASNM